MPSSLQPPGAVVAVLRSVANIASAPSVPVSAGVSTSGEGGCLLQQSADTDCSTAAGQHPHFQSTRHTDTRVRLLPATTGLVTEGEKGI